MNLFLKIKHLFFTHTYVNNPTFQGNYVPEVECVHISFYGKWIENWHLRLKNVVNNKGGIWEWAFGCLCRVKWYVSYSANSRLNIFKANAIKEVLFAIWLLNCQLHFHHILGKRCIAVDIKTENSGDHWRSTMMTMLIWAQNDQENVEKIGKCFSIKNCFHISYGLMTNCNLTTKQKPV